VSNYRGIAILSTVGKLFELLVYRHMYEDLKGQLADCQHSFAKGRPTVSNLLDYSSFFLSQLRVGVSWIVCSWIKCRLLLSHPAVSSRVLTFLIESSA
jgi:hypothetical protein